MKVLVATEESQGVRGRDLWSCIEGELVRPVEERCSRAAGGGCTCETGFIGLGSRGITTTAEVREMPALSLSEYGSALRRSLTPQERGWIRADRYAEELARIADGLTGDGAVERWDGWIGRRFDSDTGALQPDIATIADLDPRELEELDRDLGMGGPEYRPSPSAYGGPASRRRCRSRYRGAAAGSSGRPEECGSRGGSAT